MTTTKVEGIPDGYEMVRFGKTKKGESYLDSDCNIEVAKLDHCSHRLIVSKVELPYAERQAAWVKEHGIEVGSKVRVMRAFHTDETILGGDWGVGIRWNVSMASSVGRHLTVECVDAWVYAGDWSWPYFVLEPVKETTRPMSRNEFVAAWKQRGFCPLVHTDGSMSAVVCAANGALQIGLHTYLIAEIGHFKFAADDSPCSITEST